MFAAVLFSLVGGVGLAQVVSDPAQVTLRWLRLGGLIATALTAFTLTVLWGQDQTVSPAFWLAAMLAASACLCQLMLSQLGYRFAQRVAAMAVFVLASTTMALVGADLVLAAAATSDFETPSSLHLTGVWLTTPLSAGLTGGLLMTMLLGHAYLTAGGEMTQKPFLRLVRAMALLLILRAATSLVFGARLWCSDTEIYKPVMQSVMVIARYSVGLIVPAVFIYMIDDCVRRRANQSATGILYVAGFLVMMGEAFALHLMQQTGRLF